MIRLIAFAAFAFVLATSAQAMPRVPLQQSDGLTTQVRYYGYRHYGGYRHHGYRHHGYRHYGYRHYGYSYGYRPYGYYGGGYRHYGYGYRPYGYGAGRGIARRYIRRGVRRNW